MRYNNESDYIIIVLVDILAKVGIAHSLYEGFRLH